MGKKERWMEREEGRKGWKEGRKVVRNGVNHVNLDIY